MEPRLSPSSWAQLWKDELSIPVLPSAHSYEGQEPEALLSAAYRGLLLLSELPHSFLCFQSAAFSLPDFSLHEKSFGITLVAKERKSGLNSPQGLACPLPSLHRHTHPCTASRMKVIVMFSFLIASRQKIEP